MNSRTGSTRTLEVHDLFNRVTQLHKSFTSIVSKSLFFDRF